MEKQEKDSTKKDPNYFKILSLVLVIKQIINQLLQFMVFTIAATLALACCIIGELVMVKAHFFTPIPTALAFIVAGMCNLWIHDIGEYLRTHSDHALNVYELARKKHPYIEKFVVISNVLIVLIILYLNYISLSQEFSYIGLGLLILSILLFATSQYLAVKGWKKVFIEKSEVSK